MLGDLAPAAVLVLAVFVGALAAIVRLGLYIRSARLGSPEGLGPRARFVVCAVLLLIISVMLGAFVAVVVGVKHAADCGSMFGLFGEQDSSEVTSCVQRRRGWMFLPLLGFPTAAAIWLWWSVRPPKRRVSGMLP